MAECRDRSAIINLFGKARKRLRSKRGTSFLSKHLRIITMEAERTAKKKASPCGAHLGPERY
jgi:hypothetical protein